MRVNNPAPWWSSDLLPEALTFSDAGDLLSRLCRRKCHAPAVQRERALRGLGGGGAGGMPDLLLWKAEERRAKLSEVKGPRDQLSDQQRAWIAALSQSGIEVEVLKVKEPKKA